jgi:hypothetical protein
VTDASVFEPARGGLSDGTVTLALASPPATDVAVHYALVGVDATASVDFQAQQGTLVFSAGSAAPHAVTVVVVGDEDVEADETVRVEFTVADGSATLDPSFATVTIVDDDSGGGVPPFDPQ